MEDDVGMVVLQRGMEQVDIAVPHDVTRGQLLSGIYIHISLPVN